MPFELRASVHQTMRLSKIPQKLRKAMGVALREYAKGFHSRFVTDRLSGRHGRFGLNRRRGRLARSFTYEVNENALTVRMGWPRAPGSKTARPHEFGATIRAKGNWLTVPLRDASTAEGVPRRARAGDWAKTFVIKVRGKLFIVQRRGKRLAFLYILKKSVRIPARLGLKQRWGSSSERNIRLRIFNRVMRGSFD